MEEQGKPYKEADYVGEFNILYHERMAILKAIERTDGNISEASRLLGINLRTLHSKINLHRLRGNIKAYKKDKEDSELAIEIKTIKTQYGTRQRRAQM